MNGWKCNFATVVLWRLIFLALSFSPLFLVSWQSPSFICPALKVILSYKTVWCAGLKAASLCCQLCLKPRLKSLFDKYFHHNVAKEAIISFPWSLAIQDLENSFWLGTELAEFTHHSLKVPSAYSHTALMPTAGCINVSQYCTNSETDRQGL